MDSGQRAKLRSIAMTTQPTLQIGKNGITEHLLQEIDDQLPRRELIKITVLNNADFSAKEAVGTLAEQCGAQPVQAVGNKITLYRRSDKDGVKHLL